MFKNYLKIAWRNIARHKGYSFINIFGLAAGIACCILIMVWVQDELSYDRFNAKADRIYRVYQRLTLNGQARTAPVTSAPLAPALRQSFPEVEQAARIFSLGNMTVKYGEKEFRELHISYADASFFSIFTLPLLEGNANSALAAPNSMVISEKTARKYFGSEQPIGKTLKFGDGQTYTVTGIMKEIPGNFHLTFNILCSFATWIAENKREAERWGAFNTFTYVLLAPGTDSRSFLGKINRLSDEKIGRDLKQVGGSLEVFLQPLQEIHLRSHFEVDIANTNDILTVYLFSGIALFILFIACINFINLTTARFANRALEVGLKKTLGATRGSLIRQFFAETILVALLAVLLACLFSNLALPWLNAVSGKVLTRAVFLQPLFLLSLLLFAVLVGTLAGSYPAFYLSSFQPVQTLKGKLKAGAASSTFRRILVVSQFAISITLIIGTLTVLSQLNYLKNKNLGFRKEQVIVVTLPQDSKTSPVTVREELATVPGIIHATLSADVPGLNFSLTDFVPEGRTEKEGLLMQIMAVDDRFLATLGMEIIKGRNFSEEMKSDPGEAVLINETAAARLGWDDPIGKTISRKGRGANGERISIKTRIIGIVKDFHTRSLHQEIEPMVLTNTPENFQMASLRFASRSAPEVMAKLNEKWKQLFPAAAFDSFFLDESFDSMYQAEERLEKIFTSFSVLAILISCLGLFGLAAYMTEKRTKEVGIRKVLGASTWRIVLLLSNEFGKWVLIANVIAWPLAYYLMNRWLQTFAYHTAIGIGVFFFSGFAALVIALLTVSYQSVHTARRNPVDSLRYE
jgi:putative ABC transport system permease protein